MRTTMWVMAGLLAGAGMVAAPKDASAAGVGIVLSGGSGYYADAGYYGRGDGRYGREAYEAGYERGVREGIDDGRDDSRHRDGWNLWRHKRYRNADSGYRSSWGARSEYAAGYRSGFERGYRRAYAGDRGDRWNGHDGYRGDDRRDRDRGRTIYEEPDGREDSYRR